MTKFPFFLPYGRRGKVCRVWRDGVIGNTKDFDSFIVGSNPARAGRVICRASPWCAMDNAKFYKKLADFYTFICQNLLIYSKISKEKKYGKYYWKNLLYY